MGAPPDIAGAEHRYTAIETPDAGRLNVHFYEAGEGSPVLMLHGWPQHAWSWHKVIPRVAGEHRVIAPDLRGFGWTDAPGTGYEPETFAADAIALLDALGIERANLVGHDWGGFAAFIACLRRPERVNACLVLNTASPWARPSPKLMAQTWRLWYALANSAPVLGRKIQQRTDWIMRFLPRDTVHDDAITPGEAEVYAERLREPERADATVALYRNYLRAIVGVGLRRRYADMRLTVPTRFLFGAQDVYVAKELTGGWEDHADDMALELVEDSGHFIAEEKPELVAQRALELFARVKAPA
jgi:pimeloyl-ACP methyl ester carboxylesterase